MKTGTAMQRSTLANPFALMTKGPRPDNENLLGRSTPVCSNCSSDDIVCNATAQWSNECQEWQLTDTFGQPVHCNYCKHTGTIVWLKVV
jgi:hypothetical protein